MKRKLVLLLVFLFIANVGIVNAYTWPTQGTMGDGFRDASRPSHDGIDIAASTGTPCRAVASGKVVAAGTYGDGSYGNMVILDIGGKTVSYSHLSKVNVSVGQTISENDVIGLVGSTGRSTGPHLHFEVKNGSVSGTGAGAYSQYCSMNSEIDPSKFLNGAVQTSGGTVQSSSGSSATNKCTKCGGIINASGVCTNCTNSSGNDIHLSTKGATSSVCSICGSAMEANVKTDTFIIYTDPSNMHYIACKANHTHRMYIGAHDKTQRCSICAQSPLLPLTDINVFCEEEGCEGIVTTEFYYTDDGKHYRACNLNHEHQFFVSEHLPGGRCPVCGYGEAGSIFTDLPKDHWAYADVKAMKEAGFVDSVNGRLGTNGTITAQEVIKMLALVVQKKGLTENQGQLYLVDEMGKYHDTYDLYITFIRVLGNDGDNTKKLGEKEIKLILGNSDEEVLANYVLPMTREKVANLMGAILELKYGKDTTVSSANELNAKDWNKVNSIYKSRINYLAKKHIFRGSDNGDGSVNINPDANISKVEAVALINRLYNIL